MVQPSLPLWQRFAGSFEYLGIVGSAEKRADAALFLIPELRDSSIAIWKWRTQCCRLLLWLFFFNVVFCFFRGFFGDISLLFRTKLIQFNRHLLPVHNDAKFASLNWTTSVHAFAHLYIWSSTQKNTPQNTADHCLDEKKLSICHFDSWPTWMLWSGLFMFLAREKIPNRA